MLIFLATLFATLSSIWRSRAALELENLAAAIGIAAGALVGWGLSLLAGNYVPDLQLPGPILLIGSAAVVVTSAVLASLVPGARAARVDTVQALRAE